MMFGNFRGRIAKATVSRAVVFSAAFSIVIFSLHIGQAAGQFGGHHSDTGIRIFPESTTVLVKISQPGELIDEILKHPVVSKIEELDEVKKALAKPEIKNAKIGLALVESQIGEQWLPAIKKLAAGGLHIGLDASSQGIGIAFQSSDETLLKKTAGVVLGFIKNQGGKELNVRDYRGGKIAEIDNIHIGRFGDWFLISNKQDMAETMATNLLDKKPGLTNSKQFQACRSSIDVNDDIWAYVDLETLRKMDLAEELFRGDTDNPGVELLFGGVLEAMHDAKSALASLNLDNQGISLVAQVPFDSSKFAEAREYFFGPGGNGSAPAPIELPNLLGQVVSFRDLGGWWLSKEDLYPENVIAQLAQSDSQLSTVFGGMDFGSEVLGALQPGMRIVSKRQDYDPDITPDIRIPAFALVGKMRDPSVERRFRVSFQSLIGILNINSAQTGGPQIELITDRGDGITLTGGEYFMENDMEKGQLIYNFSPSLAFQGDYVVISSTRDFAKELAEATRKLDEKSETSRSNTLIQLNGPAIKMALQDNREALIAQSMLGGKASDKASAELDLVLSLMDYLEHGKVDLRFEDQQMKFDVQIGIRSH